MKRSITNILWIASFLLTGTIIISSCDTDLNLTDPSFRTNDTYFQNSNELLTGTNAIYSQLSAGQLLGREWFFLQDLRSDEVAAGGGQLEAPRRQLLIGSDSPTNNVMNDVWNGLYNVIHRANVVITNAPNVEDSPNLRDRLVAEAKFLRGWAYFELVSLWGPVPIYTEPVEEPSQFQPRAPADEVYTQIITDLEDAAEVLPESYANADRGRATWGAAKAMLGRVYMQRLDFETAKTHLQEVIDSDLYSLVDNYEDNFREETEFNEESIFEVVFIDKGDDAFNWGYTGDGANGAQSTARAQEYNPLAWRNLIPSNAYLNNFEHTETGAAETDPRLGFSVYMTGDTFNDGEDMLTDAMQNGNASQFHGESIKASWRKYMLLYKLSHDEAACDCLFRGNNHRVIRYAEVLLNMAECQNELGIIDGPEGALSYINQVRTRPSVDMPEYPTAQYPADTKEDVVEILMHERMAELGAEEIRNRDLLRWTELGYFSSYPRPGEVLLAIPQSEIDNNPELGSGDINPQNPGY